MAITVDTTSSSTISNTVTSKTWVHEVNPGDNQALYVFTVARDSSGTNDEVVSSVKFNGYNLTRIGFSTNAAAFTRVEIWKMLSPPTVTSNIVVTWSGSCQTAAAGAISLFGVHQTNGTDTSIGNTGSSISPSVSPSTSLTDGMVIGVMGADSSISNTTVFGTSIFSLDGSRQAAASYAQLSDSTSLEWLLGGTATWSAFGVVLKPADGVPSTLVGATSTRASVTSRVRKSTKTVVEILNNSLQKVAEVKSLYPINNQGMVLRYSRELSDYGQCTFRVSTKDPILTQFGDILKPHAYHVRVKRGNEIVWQGAIVDNTERNRNFVEVRAVEYLFYLDKILIRRDADKPDTDEDESNFRVFKTGTMGSIVTDIFNQAKSDLGTSHILASATIGTIETPDYPANFTDGSSPPRALTGAWSFTDAVALQYDYHSALFVIKNFGNYTNADFELTNDLVFNFKKRIGNRIAGITFTYNTIGGNIIDYNVPRLGMRMSNEIIGIAADDEGKILHATQRDSTSVSTNGLLQTAKAFNDVKSKNPLEARLAEELRLISDPEESPINIILNEKAYPLGQYGLGDIVWVKIKDHIIDFQKERRIVGITVTLHNTGRELVAIQTNRPPDNMIGAV